MYCVQCIHHDKSVTLGTGSEGICVTLTKKVRLRLYSTIGRILRTERNFSLFASSYAKNRKNTKKDSTPPATFRLAEKGL